MTPRRMRNDKTVTPRRMQHHNRRESLRYRAGAVRGAVLSHCTISQVRPAHGRTGVSPLHTLHSSPFDTPFQHARMSPRRRSKPTAPRATKSLWTRPPRGLDAVAPAPRPRNNSALPDAHHPRPSSPRPLSPPPPPRAPTRGRRARRNPVLRSRSHRAHPNARHPRPPDPGPRAPPPRPRTFHAHTMLSWMLSLMVGGVSNQLQGHGSSKVRRDIHHVYSPGGDPSRLQSCMRAARAGARSRYRALSGVRARMCR
jgi:hypothetical protein